MVQSDPVLRESDLAATGKYRGQDETRPEFMLLRDLYFEVDQHRSGFGVIVPAGYVTDRFSLPGLARGFQPEAAFWQVPALVHDWLYDVGRIKRGRADRIFSQAMARHGVKWWHRQGAFLGVRLAGHRGFGAPAEVNRDLVDRARTHGMSTWSIDRDERYQALPGRLNSLRGGPDPVQGASNPFDRETFFNGAHGASGSLFRPQPTARQADGCAGIIAAFEDVMPGGTLEQLAYILATAYHETGRRMQPVREGFAQSDEQAQKILEAAWQAGRLPLVRTPYWRDGFFGRGLVQLTHEHNYAGPLRGLVERRFGIDILTHPEALLERFDVSAFVLIEGMMRGETGRGDFTSEPLEMHINAEKVDFLSARRVVNPADLPSYSAIASYAEAFAAALREARWGRAERQ